MVNGKITMKKIISFSILIVIIVLILCGCSHKTYTDGSKTDLYGRFIILREDKGFGGNFRLMYDKDTKIVYLNIGNNYNSGLSPYYIIINGEPTIAIYGVNYEYQE